MCIYFPQSSPAVELSVIRFVCSQQNMIRSPFYNEDIEYTSVSLDRNIHLNITDITIMSGKGRTPFGKIALWPVCQGGLFLSFLF